MLYKFEQGEAVRLVPTQGGYQKERSGSVIRVTPTQVVVRPADGMCDVTFRLADGLPVRKYDQQFPCYAVRPQTSSVGEKS